MPIYEYQCKQCGQRAEEFQHGFTPKTVMCHRCQKPMERQVPHVNTDIESRPRYSFAMGVNPERIKEAQRLYPGSEYDHRGYLKIKNRKHKLFEAKRRGMIELE